MFLGVFRFTKNMKFVLKFKGRIRCIIRVFPGPFYYSCGPLLVELTGDDNSCCVVFTLKAVSVSTQYFLTSILVQLTRTPSVVTG